jgi:hypothetical protein
MKGPPLKGNLAAQAEVAATLAIHAGGASFDKLGNFVTGDHGGVPGSSHRERTVGGAPFDSLSCVVELEKAVDETGSE